MRAAKFFSLNYNYIHSYNNNILLFEEIKTTFLGWLYITVITTMKRDIIRSKLAIPL